MITCTVVNCRSHNYISKEENYQQCSNMKKEISQFDKNLDLGIQAFVKTVFIDEQKSNALTKAGLFYQLHLTTLLGGAKPRRNFHRISLNWAQLFESPSTLNPGLNLTRVQFSFLCSKAFSQIIFCVIFRASNHHQLVDKNN